MNSFFFIFDFNSCMFCVRQSFSSFFSFFFSGNQRNLMNLYNSHRKWIKMEFVGYRHQFYDSIPKKEKNKINKIHLMVTTMPPSRWWNISFVSNLFFSIFFFVMLWNNFCLRLKVKLMHSAMSKGNSQLWFQFKFTIRIF